MFVKGDYSVTSYTWSYIMATKSPTTPAAPLVRRTVGHSTGLAIGAAIDGELDVVAGFKAARNPALVEMRIAHNEYVVDALVAEEMAKLKP